MSFVNVYQFVCGHFEGGMWDLVVLMADHCPFFNFTVTLHLKLCSFSNQTIETMSLREIGPQLKLPINNGAYAIAM